MSDEKTKLPDTPVNGAFVNSLQRNNKQIKNDRAASIAEDAQLAYRRNIEDLEMSIKRMTRTQDNMLDMSPENTQSLILGKDFDSKAFIEMDAQLSLDMRNTTIKLELAQSRYTYLFGEG